MAPSPVLVGHAVGTRAKYLLLRALGWWSYAIERPGNPEALAAVGPADGEATRRRRWKQWRWGRRRQRRRPVFGPATRVLVLRRHALSWRPLQPNDGGVRLLAIEPTHAFLLRRCSPTLPGSTGDGALGAPCARVGPTRRPTLRTMRAGGSRLQAANRKVGGDHSVRQWLLVRRHCVRTTLDGLSDGAARLVRRERGRGSEGRGGSLALLSVGAAARVRRLGGCRRARASGRALAHRAARLVQFARSVPSPLGYSELCSPVLTIARP